MGKMMNVEGFVNCNRELGLETRSSTSFLCFQLFFLFPSLLGKIGNVIVRR